MVGISVHPACSVEAAERIALAFALFLEQIGRIEYFGLPEAQSGGVLGQQASADNLLVVEAKHVLIPESAYALVVEGPRGVEEAHGVGVLLLALGTEHLADARVCGVVVEVAHDDNLAGRVHVAQAVANLAYHACRVFAQRIACSAAIARRPVIDEYGERFTGQRAGNFEYVARLEIVSAGKERGVRERIVELEEARIVEQCHVDASTVGTVVVDHFEAHVGDGRALHEVVKHLSVLNLADSDDGRAGGADLAGQLRNDTGQVVEFLLVFVLGPLVGTGGKEVVVARIVGVVDRIKQVFQIVEGYGVGSGTLGLCAYADHKDHGECEHAPQAGGKEALMRLFHS